MDLNLNICNPLDDNAWDDKLLKSDIHSIFHSSSWANVLVEAYNYKPTYFVHIENDAMKIMWPFMEISSFLTGVRGVSLPFTDYCEPIFSTDMNKESIIENIIEVGKSSNWKYIEFRGGDKDLKNPHSASFYMHSLDLSKGIDELYNCIHKTTKRNIKKANREGVKVTFSHSEESIKEYYHLHRLTRKRQGLPPQPYYFFKSIYNHIISKDRGFVALARIDGNCIAGAVYFHFGKHAIYKYGASKISHQHLRPNNLLMWEAIKRYASDQFKSFDFGRTDLYQGGLRRFKKSWGTSERVLNYFKYNIGKEKYLKENLSKESTIQNIYKRMPMSLSKIVGNRLYKHMG